MKRITILSAEYFVLFEGFFLFLASLKEGSVPNIVIYLLSSGMVLILSLGINKVLKRIINKNRPLNSIFIPHNSYSFPSGHATGLFAVTYAIIIVDMKLSIASLLLSFLILFARIRSRVHDLIDCVAGAMLGLFIAYFSFPYVYQFVASVFLPRLMHIVINY